MILHFLVFYAKIKRYINKMKRYLLHVQHQSFQIFSFGVINIDGMISRLRQLIKNAHFSSRKSRRTKNGKPKLLPANCLRTRKSEKNTSGGDFLDCRSI